MTDRTHDGTFPRAARPEQVRAQRIVDGLMQAAGLRAELAISSVRILFLSIVLARFLTLGDAGTAGWRARALIEIPTLTLSLLASGLLVWVIVRRGLSPWTIDMSVVLDGLACGLTLLPGVVYPWPSYRGLLHLPDVAIVPVLCVSAGLRMSLRAAFVGAVFVTAMFAGLVALDFAVNADRLDYAISSATLYFTYVAAACALALVSVLRARRLAEQAAFHAERAEATRGGLSRALLDNHDVRSLLSSARINADLMARSLDAPAHAALGRSSQALRASLDEMVSLVDGSRDRAYLELSVSADRAITEVHAVIARAMRAAAQRFPDISFHAPRDVQPLHVLVAGGERGLERMLLNLLANASEGNGQVRAHQVVIEVMVQGARLEIVIADDGPGFEPRLLEHRGERFVSTKQGGSGLGLSLVEELARVSGGSLVLENGTRGARVRIGLLRTAPVAGGGRSLSRRRVARTRGGQKRLL